MTVSTSVFISLEELEGMLDRSENRTLEQVYCSEIEANLVKLRPFPGWQKRARFLLGRMSEKLDMPNPAGWETSTACHHLRSLRTTLEVCDSAGIRIVEFVDLLTPEVLTALQQRVAIVRDDDRSAALFCEMERSNEPPKKRSWGYPYLGGILRSLRTICIAEGLEIPDDFRAVISFCSDPGHRRDISNRVLPWSRYNAGAQALDAFGRIALATGRERKGERYCLMARVLAIALDGAPRRSEFAYAKRDRVHSNLLAESPESNIHIEAETSKVRTSRILTIDDRFALQSLESAMQGPGGRRLLRTADGEPISPEGLYGLIRSATILAVGVPASFNILRKVNAASLKTQEERRSQLAHAEHSNLADTTYHPDLAARGRANLARVRAEYTRRARAALDGSKDRSET